MLEDINVRESKAVQRHTGTTFYIATRALPKRVRRPTYVLYAFFRRADEVVDAPNPAPPDEQRRQLHWLRDGALGRVETDDDHLKTVARLVSERDLPEREVDRFIDSMLMDVDTSRYQTREDLDAYLRGSAAAVGRLMVAIMDPPKSGVAVRHADALGRAFQLTNFLRDVREDLLEYDRVYLPQAVLREHDVDPSVIEKVEFSPELGAAVRSELLRTEDLYRRGVAGIEYLPDDCQFAVLAAAVMYAAHHRLIRSRDFDVLSQSPSLSLRRRLWLVARTWYAHRRADDPLAAFYRVAAVSAGSDSSLDEGSTQRDESSQVRGVER